MYNGERSGAFYGYCHVCGRAIYVVDVEARSKEVSRMMQPLILDKPEHGVERIICLPSYPCGHVFTVVQKRYKLADGRFEYRI
jgi:hypothetical protein